MIEPQRVEEAIERAVRRCPQCDARDWSIVPYEPREHGYMWRAIKSAPEGATRVYAEKAFHALLAERDALLQALAERTKALEEIARIRTELRGDFSLSSKQSEIARQALNDATGAQATGGKS